MLASALEATVVGLLLFGSLIAIPAAAAWVGWRSMKAIPVPYRRLPPECFWIGAIPVVGVLWNCVAFPLLSVSFGSYFRSAGRDDGDGCGCLLASAAALSSLGVVVSFASARVAVTAGLVLLILSAVLTIGWLVKCDEMRNRVADSTLERRAKRRRA